MTLKIMNTLKPKFEIINDVAMKESVEEEVAFLNVKDVITAKFIKKKNS